MTNYLQNKVFIIEFRDFSNNIVQESIYGNEPHFDQYYEDVYCFQSLLDALETDPYFRESKTRHLLNFYTEEYFIDKDKEKVPVLNGNSVTRTYLDGPYIRHISHGDNLLDLINNY